MPVIEATLTAAGYCRISHVAGAGDWIGVDGTSSQGERRIVLIRAGAPTDPLVADPGGSRPIPPGPLPGLCLVRASELPGEETPPAKSGACVGEQPTLRVASPDEAGEAVRAWLEGRVFRDEGSALSHTRVCLLSLPVLCAHCAIRYRAVLYGVARFSDLRPWLPDKPVWVGSALFGQDLFHRVERTIGASLQGWELRRKEEAQAPAQTGGMAAGGSAAPIACSPIGNDHSPVGNLLSSGRKGIGLGGSMDIWPSGHAAGPLGRVIEPWRHREKLAELGHDPKRMEWLGPKRWSVCPACGEPAPGYGAGGRGLMVPKKLAAISPLQPDWLEADLHGISGLTFPAWRIEPLPGAAGSFPGVDRRLREDEWAKVVERASRRSWRAAEEALAARARAKAALRRRRELEEAETRNASSRRTALIRRLAADAIGPAMAPAAKEAFLDQWMERRFDGWWLEGSPASIAAAGPDGCRRLRLQLEEIHRLAWEDGPSCRRRLAHMVQVHPPDGLGLPIVLMLEAAGRRQGGQT